MTIESERGLGERLGRRGRRQPRVFKDKAGEECNPSSCPRKPAGPPDAEAGGSSAMPGFLQSRRTTLGKSSFAES